MTSRGPRLTQKQTEAALAAVSAMLAGAEGEGDWPADVSAAALEGAERWLRARVPNAPATALTASLSVELWEIILEALGDYLAGNAGSEDAEQARTADCCVDAERALAAAGVTLAVAQHKRRS